MPTTSHSTASTAIANLSYDDEEETLYITFTDGSRYTIENFPEIELERWLGSASIGGYFNSFVRGNY
jgi:KTSC domain